MYIKRIKDLREDNDKTQKELAEYLHITQQQYSLYESGKRTIPIDLILMLTEYYNVTSDYILGIDKKKAEPQINIKGGKNQINLGGNNYQTNN